VFAVLLAGTFVDYSTHDIPTTISWKDPDQPFARVGCDKLAGSVNGSLVVVMVMMFDQWRVTRKIGMVPHHVEWVAQHVLLSVARCRILYRIICVPDFPYRRFVTEPRTPILFSEITCTFSCSVLAFQPSHRFNPWVPLRNLLSLWGATVLAGSRYSLAARRGSAGQ